MAWEHFSPKGVEPFSTRRRVKMESWLAILEMVCSAFYNTSIPSDWFFLAPIGTFIHPSAYFIFDTSENISDGSYSWEFDKHFILFRTRVIRNEKGIWWKQSLGREDDLLAKFRILVCGNAGVGKSTIINRVFGIDVVSSSRKEPDWTQSCWLLRHLLIRTNMEFMI